MVRFFSALSAVLGCVLLSAGLGGCAFGAYQGDRLFERGDLAKAVVAYEEYLKEQPEGPARSRALFRLGMIYASPESVVYDLEHAQDLYLQLVEESSGSVYSSMVGRSLFLERRTVELQEQIEQRRQNEERLRAALEDTREELDRLQSEIGVRTEELLQREEDLRRLTRELQEALAEKEDWEQQIERLTAALELLKKIDLQPQR